MSHTFALQLSLKIQITNVEVQKIDGIILETYGIVVSPFSILDKDSRKKFFDKGFLLANVKPDVVFEMFFPIISNTIIDFQAQDL